VEESTPEATVEQSTEEATVEATESSTEEATIQESTSEATVETAEPSIEAPSEEEPTTEPQTEPAQEDTLQQSTEEATVQESTSEASVEADGTKEKVTGESTQPSVGNPAGEDVEDGREAAVPEISSEEGQPREPEVAQPDDDRSGSVQKYYRYDHGNILEGISLNPGTSEEQLNLLDKRVNRLMSSKIMPQEDVDESDIIEIEEEIKNEEGVTASTDRTSLPDTGETDYTILYGTTLLIAGAILLFITRRPNSKKCK
jgi:LPXTG-motif cell wall-anchored protein